MIDYENAISALRLDIVKITQLERERLDLLHQPLSPAQKDERDRGIKREIERLHLLVVGTLRELVEFPPHHMRHEQLLAQFHGVATLDKSVFVMTKFPDPKKPGPVDAQLAAVIQAVCEDRKRQSVPPNPLGQRRTLSPWVPPRHSNCRGQISSRAEPQRRHGVGLDARHGA